MNKDCVQSMKVLTNLMSLMISQLDLVLLSSSNKCGMVTKNNLGLSLLISWIVVTADIYTPVLVSFNLSLK